MISAYEHGRNAAKHAKHIQACPFDTGTPEWREWRAGFCALSQISPNSFYRFGNGHAKACQAFAGRSRPPIFIIVDTDTVASCVLTLSYFTLWPVPSRPRSLV